MKKLILISTLVLPSFSTLANGAPGKWELRLGNQTPANALVVWHQSNHSPFYLCQTGVIFGGVQLGKTWNSHAMCNVPFSTQEKLQYLYKVFMVNDYEDHVHHWINYNCQPITHHSFAVGPENNGKILYLCRAKADGDMQPGKTWTGYSGCNLHYRGQEKGIRPSELFVWGHRHRHHHHWH